MARGRMLSVTISESKKFGNVSSNTNRLVYLMLLPWVDREGRYEADTTLIAHRVLMRCGITEAEVDVALKDLQRCGLIKLYSAQGKRVLEVIDFLKWNTPHYKEPKSNLPAADADEATHEPVSSHTQEANVAPTLRQGHADVAPTLAIREVKEREVEVKERESSPPTPRTENHAPSDDDDDDSTIVSEALNAVDRRRARNYSTGLLAQQHPEAHAALQDLQSVYAFKPAQFVIYAERFLELSRDHGGGVVAAACEAVLSNGERIRNPLTYLRKILTNHAAESARLGPTAGTPDFKADLDSIFGAN